MKPLARVLIANRGEIACRVIAACRELGLRSVAVYSDADAEALHVRLADEAVAIGPSEPARSYLAIDRLLGAAEKTGCDALHPGYGFRAESADLAAACAERGVVFVGPTAAAIRTMGDKRAARALAREAEVPVVPGYEGGIEGAGRAAAAIGWPVLVKAALGGGGKGMRRVDDAHGLDEALAAAARIARSSFGDASVYLERYLEDARHIEVQVLGDGRGGAVHVHERECSLQRRHQKVIEEAPAPALDPALRDRMCAAAARLAARVSYRSAGTCEFLLAPDRQFYFLEMNTRIQVEHPVTELTAGIDLVKAQFRIAAGEPLPAQESIAPRGHAIEARLTAEDPVRGFLPQAGPILRFDVPNLPGIRLDSGFARGDTVPADYDSLLAKVIAWGADRAEALGRLRIALDGTIVHGPGTNLELLRFLVRHPRVIAGELTTQLLEAELLPSFLARAAGPVPPVLLAAAAIAETLGGAGAAAAAEGATGGGSDADRVDPFHRLGRFRIGGA
jgi:acetyl-CoA/propionyl-CoA carboxylase biotin carboxyl carrier protein